MFTLPIGIFGAGAEDVVFDFSGGTVPTGMVVNSAGNTVWSETGAAALQGSPTTPGNNVGVFANRGRGRGLLVFPEKVNLVRTDPTVPGVDSCFNLVGGWGHSASGYERYTAQGLGPDGATQMCSVGDNSAVVQGAVFTVLIGVYTGLAVGSIWVRDCDGTEPNPLTAPTSPGVLIGVGSTGLETATLGSGTTWRRVNVLLNGTPDLALKPAGANGVVGPTGGVLVGFAGSAVGVDAGPFIDNLASAAATAKLSDVHLLDPTEAIVGSAWHVGGKFQQTTLRSWDLIPTQSGTIGNYIYLANMATPDGAFALRARYDNSQFEWTLVARGTNIITDTRTSGESGLAPSGDYLAKAQWEAKVLPGGESYFVVGFDGFFRERKVADAGAAIPTPTAHYFMSSAADTQVTPGIVEEVRALGNDTWIAPAIVIAGDSILDDGNASATMVHAVGAGMLSNAQVDAGLNNILGLQCHGNTFAQQTTKLNALRAANAASVRAVVISMGWNDFAAAPSNNAATRVNCQALIDAAVAKFPTAKIFLYSTTPGRGGVSAATYANWLSYVADVTAGNVYTGTYLQSTYLSENVIFNDGSNYLQAALDIGDGLHPNQAGKTAIETKLMADLVSAGVIQ